MEKGYRQVTVKADPFLDMLRHGNAVISAFKTHRMQNDMAARLLDKDGKLKPFRTWMRDVKDIASHYTVRWLRTEYDTAILRAHEAAAWRQARQEADVLPNLRWMPTTSASPDVIHKAFWSMKLTLPVNHPFWKKHRPQDRWGCKCSIMQTDEPATELKGLGKADKIKPVPGLDNNPADDGMVFGKSHPYITKAYPGAEEAVEKVIMQSRRAEIKIKARKFLNTVLVNESYGKPITLSVGGIKEWVNQPHKHYIKKNELLLSIDEVIRSAHYIGSGKDKHNKSITMHLFETQINNEKSWIVVREMNDGVSRLHSISDSKEILKFIEKRNE